MDEHEIHKVVGVQARGTYDGLSWFICGVTRHILLMKIVLPGFTSDYKCAIRVVTFSSESNFYKVMFPFYRLSNISR